MWYVLSLQIINAESVKKENKGKSAMSYSLCSTLSLGCNGKGGKTQHIIKSSLSVKCR